MDTLGEHQLLQADAFQSAQPLNIQTGFHRHVLTMVPPLQQNVSGGSGGGGVRLVRDHLVREAAAAEVQGVELATGQTL